MRALFPTAQEAKTWPRLLKKGSVSQTLRVSGDDSIIQDRSSLAYDLATGWLLAARQVLAHDHH